MKYYKTNPLLNLQPVSIDWIYRYEPIFEFILDNHLSDSKILDYGCGNVGLGCVFTKEYFGIDLAPIQPAVSNLRPINGVHPFELQETFDLVCAVDVLEHIPVNQRAMFFQTMSRIVRRYLILTFPSAESGYRLDVETGTFLNFNGNLPDWLLEHLSLKHPRTDEVVSLASQHGFRLLRLVKNTHRVMHYLGCLGLYVGGDLKIQVLNDIHYLNHLHQSEEGIDMYRSVLFLEVNQ